MNLGRPPLKWNVIYTYVPVRAGAGRCRGEPLSSNPRLWQSGEAVSPRRRTASAGASLDEPADLKSDNIVLRYTALLFSKHIKLSFKPHHLKEHLYTFMLPTYLFFYSIVKYCQSLPITVVKNCQESKVLKKSLPMLTYHTVKILVSKSVIKKILVSDIVNDKFSDDHKNCHFYTVWIQYFTKRIGDVFLIAKYTRIKSIKFLRCCVSVSIELESPVVVLPRNAHSSQVLLAHLGRMSLTNRPGPPHHTLYKVRVRDISLASVSITLYLCYIFFHSGLSYKIGSQWS